MEYMESKMQEQYDAQNELIKEISRLQDLLTKHGICEDCGELYNHHFDEPFASCGCKQSEWYGLTPHMKQVLELKTERDALAAQVNAFQSALMQCVDLVSEHFYDDAFRSAQKIIAETPQQCLREVQAEAGVKGLRRGVALASGGDISLDSILVKIWSDGYAESVRQGGAE